MKMPPICACICGQCVESSDENLVIPFFLPPPPPPSLPFPAPYCGMQRAKAITSTGAPGTAFGNESDSGRETKQSIEINTYYQHRQLNLNFLILSWTPEELKARYSNIDRVPSCVWGTTANYRPGFRPVLGFSGAAGLLALF